MPNLELIKSNEENRNLNIPVYISFSNIFSKNEYDNILKLLKIKKDSLVTQEIYGDGNCLFRSISYFLTGIESYQIHMRNFLYNYIISRVIYINIHPYLYNYLRIL